MRVPSELNVSSVMNVVPLEGTVVLDSAITNYMIDEHQREH